MMQTIYKTYLYKNLAQDVTKFLKRNMKNIDFDKEYWLHKAGLAPYSPAKSTFGGLTLLVLGGLAGAAIALALAPKTGVELRSDVKDRALKLLDRANSSMAERNVEVPIRA